MDRKVISLLVLFFCFSLYSCSFPRQNVKTPSSGSNYCVPLPLGFEESDLIGTWEVNFGGMSRTDTLTIRNDGMYKQLFINSNTNYRYESPWYKWWLDDRPTGEAYLHFEKMLFCGDAEDTCIDPKTKMGFYDACEDKWLNMDGEFILAVIGDEETDKGIGLQVLLPSGWDFITAIYNLQDINVGK